MDNDVLQQKHLKDLKRSANLSGNGALRYEYIYTKDQLFDAYLNRMDDLGYPLRVEPKRDRFVMNKKALMSALEQATSQALDEMQTEIYAFVKNDVYQKIQQSASGVLNTIHYDGQKFVNSARQSDAMDWAIFLGKAFGNKLAKTIGTIFEDIVNGGKKKKRK